jgi:hypothetical protein
MIRTMWSRSASGWRLAAWNGRNRHQHVWRPALVEVPHKETGEALDTFVAAAELLEVGTR